MSALDKVETMTSPSSCINKAIKEGYTHNFTITPKGLYNFSDNKETWYSPNDVSIKNFFRYEGQSDPADNMIIYMIETSDGLRGTLVDGYGPTSDKYVSNFIVEVENIQKERTKTPESIPRWKRFISWLYWKKSSK